MLEKFLSATERVMQFERYRSVPLTRTFTELVDPLHQDLSAMQTDYLRILGHVLSETRKLRNADAPMAVDLIDLVLDLEDERLALIHREYRIGDFENEIDRLSEDVGHPCAPFLRACSDYLARRGMSSYSAQALSILRHARAEPSKYAWHEITQAIETHVRELDRAWERVDSTHSELAFAVQRVREAKRMQSAESQNPPGRRVVRDNRHARTKV